jgi:ribonuclease HI
MDEIVIPVFKQKHKLKKCQIFPQTEYTLFFDGCSKGNPGLSGIGAVIYKNNVEHWASSRFIGEGTNNESEYKALIMGLEEAKERNISELTVYGDSQLVINQVNGLFQVKAKNLFKFYENVMILKKSFKVILFIHVPREENQRADELSNLALSIVETKEESLPFIQTMTEAWKEEEKVEKLTKKFLFLPKI